MMDSLAAPMPKVTIASAAVGCDICRNRLCAIQSLSPNDIALLRHIAAGRTNVQIGLQSHRSEKTIRNQLTMLYAKLDARNRAEAVAIYMRMGGT